MHRPGDKPEFGVSDQRGRNMLSERFKDVDTICNAQLTRDCLTYIKASKVVLAAFGLDRESCGSSATSSVRFVT